MVCVLLFGVQLASHVRGELYDASNRSMFDVLFARTARFN